MSAAWYPAGAAAMVDAMLSLLQFLVAVPPNVVGANDELVFALA
jgi:hypothetical protein